MGIGRMVGRQHSRILWPHCWALLVGWMCVAGPITSTAQVRPRNPEALRLLQSNYTDVHAAYFEKLRRLRGDSLDAGLTDLAESITPLMQPPDNTRIFVGSLPRQMQPDIPFDMPDAERNLRVELRRQRETYARELYALSRRALHNGYPGYAYDLVRELSIHDPDHELARGLLGYVKYRGEWVTPFAKSMLVKGLEWHDDFGWLPKNHVDRYVAGERYLDGKWISAEKEAVIRQDFDHAWVIQTDHYLIRTNYSLERGVELGRALEDFYVFFHQTFAGFFNDPEQLQQIFNGNARMNNRNAKQYLVHYYRTKDEYISRLEPLFPAIRQTNGIYLTGDRTIHFYFDPQGAPEDTLFHEATHQLFYESHVQNRPIADKANFWLIEGIACYMESFRRYDGEFSVGDPRHIRFAGARMNYLDKMYYVPMDELTALGSQEFQRAPHLVQNYTQAAGMAHFFMQYDNGRYRDALVTHLTELYSANARKREFPQSLEVLTDTPFLDLDQQYGEWMKLTRAEEQAAAATEAAAPRQ